MEHPTLAQRARQHIVERIAPVLDLVPAVDQNVLGDAATAEGAQQAHRPGATVAARPEGFGLDDYEIDIRGRRASPRAREPNRITCSGSAASTMAVTIRRSSVSSTSVESGFRAPPWLFGAPVRRDRGRERGAALPAGREVRSCAVPWQTIYRGGRRRGDHAASFDPLSSGHVQSIDAPRDPERQVRLSPGTSASSPGPISDSPTPSTRSTLARRDRG